MKKISIIMSGLLACLFFVSMFFSMGNDNFKNALNANGYFDKLNFETDKGISLILNNQIIENEAYQTQLYEIFKKYDVVATGFLQSENIHAQSNSVYIYATSDIYVDDIQTINNERIQFSNEDENRYYTLDTNNNENAILIDLLNPLFYDYVVPYEYHPFHQAIGNKIPTLYTIEGISVEEFENEIKGTDFRNYIENLSVLDEHGTFTIIKDEGIQFDPNNILFICMGLACVSLMMLIVVNTIKHKKYIAVCRLNGVGKVKILKNKFLLFLLSLALSYALVQILLLLIFGGGFREASEAFYQIIVLSILGFLGVIVLLIVFVYVYLSLYRNFHDLKQNKINSFSIYLNIIVKTLATAILMAPFVSIVPDFYIQANEAKLLYEHKIENENRYAIRVFADKYTNEIGGEAAVDINRDIIEHLSNEYEGMYYNLYDWVVQSEISKDVYDPVTGTMDQSYEVPFIYVNRNYLNDYPVIEHGTNNQIDIDSLSGGVLLVPKRYEESASLESYKQWYVYQEVIFVEDFIQQFKTLDFREVEDNAKYIKNPIVYVCDENIAETLNGSGSYYFNTTNLPKVYDELSEMGYKDNVDLYSLYPEVQMAFHRHLVTFSSMLFLLIGYLSVYLVFVYQSIYVYLDVFKKKISIQYLNGYSYIKRYHEIYIINACAYIIAGIIASLVYHVEIKGIVLYILFFGCMEVLFEAYQIRRFQKKEGMNALK